MLKPDQVVYVFGHDFDEAVLIHGKTTIGKLQDALVVRSDKPVEDLPMMEDILGYDLIDMVFVLKEFDVKTQEVNKDENGEPIDVFALLESHGVVPVNAKDSVWGLSLNSEEEAVKTAYTLLQTLALKQVKLH